jgi:hypothetical protein
MRCLRVGWFLVAGLVLAGCPKPVTEPPSPFYEDSDVKQLVALSWLEGDELAYAGSYGNVGEVAGNSRVAVVNLDGERLATIDGDEQVDEPVDYLSSPHELVVFREYCDGHYSLRLWDPRADRAEAIEDAECKINSRVALANEFSRPAFAVGPQDLWVAYARARDNVNAEIVVYELDSQATRVLTEGWPLVASPDGSELLGLDGDWRDEPHPFWAVSLTDGSRREFPALPSLYPRELRWTADGPLLLSITPMDGWTGTIHELETGELRTSWKLRDTPTVGMDWSANGRAVAYWYSIGGPGSWFSGDDDLPHIILYAVDASTGEKHTLVDTEGFPGPIAIDRAGERVAFAIGTELHVLSLPF